MAMSNWSGPISSENGFITPITYITEADRVAGSGVVAIPAGANVVILSAADGGPSVTTTFTLPLVDTINGETFTITNADPYFNGIRGSILNYDAAIDHVLAGYETAPGVYQKVNGSASGVDVLHGTVVQWGGNGNPDAPWAAITSNLAAAA
jgi:hypothetical protein